MQIRSLPAASNGDFVERLLKLYRRQAAERLESLHYATMEQDWTAVHRVAHAWKTSAGQLGAKRLHAMLGRLDQKARLGRPPKLSRTMEDIAAEHQRVLQALES